jgi:Leucine-rich repeat (LRR) protein
MRLNSSYNYTSPLAPKLLEYLESLTVLDLSNNGLTSWNDDIFVKNKNLIHLYLQKNQLVISMILFFFQQSKYKRKLSHPLSYVAVQSEI